MKRELITILLLCVVNFCFSQINDSVYHQLQEIEIMPVSGESKLRSLFPEGTVNLIDLEKQPGWCLLPAVNNIPGVRMEERSPASYRFSIRGSLLRSPFGTRNIKIYLADLPFTDAGGNTYLNSLDAGNLNGLKILKGPESSVFGANTGGAVLIDPILKTPDSLKIMVDLKAGSYNSFHQHFLIQVRGKRSLFTINQAYQSSEGYRKNSAMQRHYAQLSENWSYNQKGQLRFLLLFSDLKYQAPGGLTRRQFEADPRQARLPTATLPGAEQQKSAVYNKTVFGGMTHDVNFSKKIRHVISVFGSHTDFKNPFITNFEQRTEYSIGSRSYLEGSLGDPTKITTKWDIGGECQQTNSDISNFGNKEGAKDTMQASDRLTAQQGFFFAKILFDIYGRLLIEASCSYNFFSYTYRNIFPLAETSDHKTTFNPQLMPRIAVSYKFNRNLSWRSSVSKGYSSPTLAEIRSSDNVVNSALGPETGLNYETGFRLRDNKDYLWMDASVFYFALKNAIVRRVNDNGAEYFINAGGTRQPGLETQMNLWIIKKRAAGFLRSLQVKGNLTWNQFTFDRYQIGTTDYSGNKLTGVPDYTTAESISAEFAANISMYIQYFYSAGIPLNDANTIKSNGYHLVQLKTQWKTSFNRVEFKISAGIDNLLNEVYSLGHDLNAAGERYYNAAAPRNYYLGIKIEL